MPVDQYIGGIDHATVHLIYARFWVKVLNDLGLLGFREPFARFFTNGWVTIGKREDVEASGNVVGPDEFVERYGADALPAVHPLPGPRRPGHGVDGDERRGRWRASCGGCGGSSHEVAERERRPASPADGPLARKAHETIAKVTDDIGRRFAFNTPIAAVMELVNELSRATRRSRPRASPPRRRCR